MSTTFNLSDPSNYAKVAFLGTTSTADPTWTVWPSGPTRYGFAVQINGTDATANIYDAITSVIVDGVTYHPATFPGEFGQVVLFSGLSDGPHNV
jgi:hypothetical protein